MKLTRTLLSSRPGPWSFLIGLLSAGVLLYFFGMEQGQFAANGNLIFQKHEYWRAFTTPLLHADLGHLGSNFLFFLILSVLLNTYFGWTVFPILSFLMGGVISLITLHFYPPQVYLVGISGVIYFMAAFWATMYVLIERQHTLTRRLLNSIGITLIFFFPEVFDVKTSYLAHAVGFALGVPSALVYFGLNYPRIRKQEVWIEKKPGPDLPWYEAEFEVLPESSEKIPRPHLGPNDVPTSGNEL